MKVLMPNGKEYEFACASFTPEVVRLIEIMEDIGPGGRAEKPAELLRILRSVMISSLKSGGHSLDEAEEAVCSLPLGEGMLQYLEKIRKAIGLD